MVQKLQIKSYHILIFSWEADDKLILPLGADLRVVTQFRDRISKLSMSPPPVAKTPGTSSVPL